MRHTPRAPPHTRRVDGLVVERRNIHVVGKRAAVERDISDNTA